MSQSVSVCAVHWTKAGTLVGGAIGILPALPRDAQCDSDCFMHSGIALDVSVRRLAGRAEA